MRKIFLVFLCAASALLISSCARAPRPHVTPGFVSPTPAVGGIYHTVERGETLYRISKLYGIDVSELMRVNHIYSPSQLALGQQLFIPQYPATAVIVPYRSEVMTLEKARDIIGPRNPTSRWETITVHHSGTVSGNARLFDRDHRRRKMGGLFYHFVIGNGTRTPDGFVEIGWRWKKQVKANRPYDIQICLVGNFDQQQVSEVQLDTLTKLIVVLREEYGIPMSGIRKHNDIPGKHTDCPGANFPFQRLISKVAEQSYHT